MEYVQGVVNFVEFASLTAHNGKISCHCNQCVKEFNYVARVRFGIWVRVRVRVRDSVIFEKGGCGCGGTRRLKNY